MTEIKFRKIKKNGRKRTVPIFVGRKAPRERQLTAREIEDLTGVGIKHPGTLRKLAEIYRLDYSRPRLKGIAESDIRYVSGGVKND